MIFVTVGAQMPFDRLIISIDEWSRLADYEVFAQIGQTDYIPQHIDWCHHLDSIQFLEKVKCAEAIVSHAGMGTIITSLEFGKPILVMPRRPENHETRNNHQIATVNYFQAFDRVNVVMNESDLNDELNSLLSSPVFFNKHDLIHPFASKKLISTLRTFINQCNRSAP